MLPNLDQLVAKCRALGKEPIPSGKRLSKDDCVLILREHYMPAGGLPYEEIEPMLCFSSWNLKPAEEDASWTRPGWVAQRKLNGCRVVVHFVKGVGIFAHSRTISLKTYRFQELTQQFLWCAHVPSFSASIDAEALCEKPIDTRAYTTKGELTKTSLHSTTSLLHLEAGASRRLQQEQDAGLVLRVFDVMKLEHRDFRNIRLRDRLPEMDQFFTLLNADLPANLRSLFQLESVVVEDRKEFYHEVIRSGGEGVILKSLNSTYEDSSSRRRDAWIKCKRRQEQDAFVSGFKRGDKGSGWENLIGALEFSVNLSEGGTHVMGFISNLPMEMRKAISLYDQGTDTVTLRPDFYGRVAEISGQDVSARELRFSHCTLDRWRPMEGPDAKGRDECITSMENLRNASEWVG